MRHRKRIPGTAFCLLGLTAAVLCAAWPVQAAPSEAAPVIEEGVHVRDVDLGGMTASAARAKLERYFGGIASSALTVTFDGQEAVTTPGDLGLTWDVDAAVEEAVSLGKSGQLIARYKSRMDLKYEPVEIPVGTGFDTAAVRTFVEDEIASHDTEKADASLTVEGGEIEVVPETDGLVTDVTATVDAITEALGTSLSEDMTVEAVVEVTVPDITAEDLSEVRDVLGRFSTDYSSSSSGRKTNVRIASERLDGILMMPGDSLSVSDTILSRSPENGYQLATQYNNGETEEAYGGGVCQVSTTLYNAVIRAELQIDERHPHSMVVSYVPYSSDAAIAEGSKDFIFTNSTDAPIYIASYADGETLSFTIYGKETRDADRRIEFVSETLSSVTPEPTEISDDSLAEGESRTEGSVHPAVTSTLTKIVYENEVEADRVVLNEDSYQGSGLTIYRGTKKEEPETAQAEESSTPAAEEKEETKKEETEQAAETKKSEETAQAEEEAETEPETEAKKETKKKEKKSSSSEAEEGGEDAEEPDE